MLTHRVGELEEQVQDLSSSLLQKDKDVEVNLVFPSKKYVSQAETRVGFGLEYDLFSVRQFYQEELSQERLRIEQEMQVSSALLGDLLQHWII